MTNQRYNQLMINPEEKLTQQEIAEGWHFCIEYDFVLGTKLTFEGCSCELKQEVKETV